MGAVLFFSAVLLCSPPRVAIVTRMRIVRRPNHRNPTATPSSAPQGGYTLVHAATSPQLEGRGGVYLDNCRVTPAHVPPLPDTPAWLWERTSAHVGLA